MPRKAATVAIYPDRASHLLLAAVGELMAVATVVVAGQPRPEVVSNPWLYEEPINTIFVGLMVALFGISPLLLVLRAVLGWPVLTLDAEGIHYYRWVLSRRLVRWDEIQWVRTSTRKQQTDHPYHSYTTRPACPWRQGRDQDRPGAEPHHAPYRGGGQARQTARTCHAASCGGASDQGALPDAKNTLTHICQPSDTEATQLGAMLSV